MILLLALHQKKIRGIFAPYNGAKTKWRGLSKTDSANTFYVGPTDVQFRLLPFLSVRVCQRHTLRLPHSTSQAAVAPALARADMRLIFAASLLVLASRAQVRDRGRKEGGRVQRVVSRQTQGKKNGGCSAGSL